jgi:AcrR family transcriptional regulator
MSLYHHVANKDALLAGVVDVVVEEINSEVAHLDAPAGEDDWRAALRARILTARGVLLRHPWLPRVLEDATSFSLPVARYFDGVLGTLRAGGFSYDLAHHAMHALGSRALGFTQELFEPDDPDVGEEQALALLAEAADQLPHLVGMMAEIGHDDADGTLGWCDDQTEFEFGLDLLLEGLERRRRGA